MATETKYNGWTNYATWRINLEFFQNLIVDPNDYEDEYALAKKLEDLIDEAIYEMYENKYDFIRGWAKAFAESANYVEIAKHLLDQE